MLCSLFLFLSYTHCHLCWHSRLCFTFVVHFPSLPAAALPAVNTVVVNIHDPNTKVDIETLPSLSKSRPVFSISLFLCSVHRGCTRNGREYQEWQLVPEWHEPSGMAGGTRNGMRYQEWQDVPGRAGGTRNGRRSQGWQEVPGMAGGTRNGKGSQEWQEVPGMAKGPRNGRRSQE